MDSLRYTPFPDLSCHQQPDEEPWTLSAHPIYKDFSLPFEVLVIAWSRFLRAYTAADDVIFATDDSAVLVRTSQDHDSFEHCSQTPSHLSQAAGLSYTGALPPQGRHWSLWLSHDPSVHSGVLHVSDRLPSSHGDELGRQFCHILRRQAASRGQTLPQQAFRDPLLSIVNPSPGRINGPQTLHGLLRPYARSGNVAIDHLDARGERHVFTYKELDSKSSRLAEHLESALDRAHGKRIVPLLIVQGPLLYISILAILKAGCAYCPLNLDAPSERIKYIFKDVDASVVLTTTDLKHRFPRDVDIESICADEADPRLDRSVSLRSNHLPNDICYLMYTSGSTGTPKGVSLSHGAVIQSLLAHETHIPEFKRFLQFAAPTFDVSVFEIFFPLLRGQTVVSCDRSRLLTDLPGVIQSLDIDAAELTPTVAGTLLRRRANAPTLKVLLTIGEMLTRDLIVEFGGSKDRESMLYAMYGPTEAAIHCTLQPKMSSDAKVGCIGRPLPSASAFVLSTDNTDQPDILPLGQQGELAIGGHQLAQGYLNRQEQTETSFVNHPQYGRLYRTGDRARMLPDGSLECLGRLSVGQVKLRGQRIELGEVDSAIVGSPGVRSAVASVLRDQLVAFYIPDSLDVEERDIMAHCRSWLPSFMVPNRLMSLEDFPRLSSGKIDKATLEQNYSEHPLEGSEQESNDLDDLGLRVRSILGDVLGFTPGSQTSDLARSGIDSLKSIRLASALRETLKVDVNAADIMAATSFGQLYKVVRASEPHVPHQPQSQPYNALNEKLKADVMDMSRADIDLAQVVSVLACTPLQNAMLVETAKDGQAYCNSIELSFSEVLSAEEVEVAFTAVANACEIMRSGFVVTGSPQSPYAHVVQSSLRKDQFVWVSQFDRAFRIDKPADLLRPLRIQLTVVNGRVNALVHVHHALYDGWSWDLVLEDLNRELEGKAKRDRPSFFGVAAYLHEWRTSSKAKEAADFWKETLSSAIPSVLPQINSRSGLPRESQWCSRKSSLSRKELTQYADLVGIHPQVICQAAFAYALSHYSGIKDLIIGTVLSGRFLPLTRIEEVVGPIISTLPLRIGIDADVSCREWLRALQSRNQELIPHSTMPLQDIKKAASLMAEEDLFDVLMIWQESLTTDGTGPNLVTQVDQTDYLEYKLLFEMIPDKDSLVLKATFDSNCLERPLVEILLAQVDVMVQSIMSDDNQIVGGIASKMPQNLISIHNPHPNQYGTDGSALISVESWAAHEPSRPAVVFAEDFESSSNAFKTLSYGDLNMLSTQMAHAIVQQGVQPNDLVCICMQKSLWLYISILATVKAGAGYLPITPETPHERIRSILDEAKVKFCLTNESSPSFLASIDKWSILDISTVELSSHPTNAISQRPSPDDVAYVIFTSGSTGTPKGVTITRRNLASNLEVLKNIYPVPSESGSRLLQACSQAFDVSVFEIFFSWHTGMCLCSASNSTLFRDLEGAINKLTITHLSLTPTVASLIRPENVPTVMFLVTAGEAMTPTVHRRWADKGLFQGYGPSETTNICSVDPNVSLDSSTRLVGPPFDNTSAFVIDAEASGFKLVPKGGVGELCFGGDQVFRGYLNRPDLNDRNIVRHPEFGRLYRSGDLGRMLANGDMLCVGRIDDQVKVRGQRVELGEINKCIIGIPAVRDCATIIVDLPGSGSQAPVAFWVMDTDRPDSDPSASVIPIDSEVQSTIAKVFKRCHSQLPTYMHPVSAVPLFALPMTSQGKIDKRKLNALYRGLDEHVLQSVAEPELEDDDNTTFSRLEEQLAAAVSAIAGVPTSKLGRNTSLLTFGIDSVSAIALATSLRNSLSVSKVDVSIILRNNTIAKLASAISSIEDSPVSDPRKLEDLFEMDSLADIKSHFPSAEAIYPCMPLQEAMLSASSSGDPQTYYHSTLFNLNGDNSLLKDVWQSMVRRHAILRTCFLATAQKSRPYAQVVLDSANLPWIEENASDLDDNQLLIRQSMETAARHSEHENPPFILSMFSNSTGKTIKLVLTMHHALYDGVALSNLFSDVEKTFFGSELPQALSYEPFLQQALFYDTIAADRYWDNLLEDFEPSSPLDLTGKSETYKKNLNGSTSVTYSIETPLKLIESTCRESGISLLAMCQAAWAKVISSFLGEDDVCFGNVVSGRTVAVDGIQDLVAPCFNTLPVRISVSPEISNLALAEKLQNINSDSLAFQFTPLRRIQSRTTSDGRHLFETLFILQQAGHTFDQSIWQQEAESGEMGFPIVCEFWPDPLKDAISVTLHCRRSVVLREDTQIIFDVLSAALSSFISSPSTPSVEIDSVRPGVHSFSQPSESDIQVPDSDLLHTAFERNVSRIPQLPALTFLSEHGEIKTWTYSQLDSWANKIAQTLVRHGVCIEEAVVVHIAKSPQFYAAILGVLKSGGSFTPFDPATPVQRKSFMLEQLKPRFVLHNGGHMSWCSSRAIDVSQLGSESPDGTSFEAVQKPTSSSNIAYRLYTSGSTGEPKAVSVAHSNAIHTIAVSPQVLEWNQSSKLLQFASTTFDMCYYDCFLAWSHGFCLCAASQSVMLNDIHHTIEALGINMLDLTPSVASTLDKSKAKSIESLYCIGEAMPQSLVDDWAGRCFNAYGPTEAAMCVTIFPVSREIRPSVIGHPLQGTRFAVMRRDLKVPVPVFGVGELWIGGPQVACGYHANESLTAETFVESNGERWYKTGDLVRMLGNGTFDFVGRADDQVKIRGLRVELQEITSIIKSLDEVVRDATTQVFKRDESSKEQLVTFVVAKSKLPPDQQPDFVSTVRSHLSAKLPSYMVPTEFLVIEKIPLSSAGKLDKKALFREFKEKASAQRETEQNLEHAWTGAESQVREVLSNFVSIPVDQILPDTTIYRLGLDSISAVQIASELRRRGHQLSATDVISNPSVRSLALLLKVAEDEVGSTSTTTLKGPERNLFDFPAFDGQHRSQICQKLGLKPTDLAFVRPCTSLQAGMIAQFLHSEGQDYLNHLWLRFDPDVKSNSVLEALDAVQEKHDMLRTGFTSTGDQQYPFAMLTYRARRSSIPINSASSGNVNENDWSKTVSEDMFQNLHLPAWRLRLEDGANEVLLQLSMHHAIYDATSLQLILGDMTNLLGGRRIDTHVDIETSLTDLLQMDSLDHGAAEKYWQEVGNRAVPNSFPVLTPYKEEETTFTLVEHELSHSRTVLEKACRDTGVTVQTVGQAAWAKILSAYIGEPSVIFGTVMSGRTTEEAQHLAFPCINTLPVAIELSPDNQTLLDAIMQHNSMLHKYQQLSLTTIQRWMGKDEGQLFDTLFVYQAQTTDEDVEKPWQIVDEKATVNYPISIELMTKRDVFSVRITSRKDVVPQEQARIILEQFDHEFCRLLSVERNNAAVFQPSLYSITPAKHEELPSDSSLLHHFVEHGASAYPQRPALEFVSSVSQHRIDSQVWTYAQLNSEANRIAHLIVQRGILPGSILGICFDKCPEASFAILGILKAGCAFLALDPGAPVERKAFILQDAHAAALFTIEPLAKPLAGHLSCPIVSLDKVDRENLPITKPELPQYIDPASTSYCLYTSGTTGQPKGCELSHKNAVQFVLGFQRILRWSDNSKFLQFASFHFDVSVMEQFFSWSVGIRVISTPRDTLFEDLAGFIRALEITHIDLTPTLAVLLRPSDVPSLCTPESVFITGGEQLKQQIIDEWGPIGTIYNGYGPTEATIGCTMFPRVPSGGKPSNIGPQYQNVGSYVFEPATNTPVLRGAIGELFVSGPLVAKGYLNRAQLTDASFPTVKINGCEDRLYRTGDLVRVLHDNTFMFLGRKDDQVKLRGQRLEIGEINATIKQADEDIKDVATVVLKHPQQQKDQLVSFILGNSYEKADSAPQVQHAGEHAPLLHAIQDQCNTRLPGYMVPTHFVLTSSLPLSANNKLDVKVLKKIYSELGPEEHAPHSSDGKADSDASTEEHKLLIDTISEYLSIDSASISATSSLFGLGLDSITVIGFAQKLKDAGFGNAQASTVMRNATVGRLAQALKTNQGTSSAEDTSIHAAKQYMSAFEHRHKTAAAEVLELKQRDIEYIAPCTPLQQGIISRTLESDKPVYFAEFRFKLQDGIDLKRLYKAWSQAFKQLPILRTKFMSNEDGFAQVAVKHVEVPWVEHEAQSDTEAVNQLDQAYKAWSTQDQTAIVRPFEISVVKVDQKATMGLHIFHALYDGNSLPQLLDSIKSLYRGDEDPFSGPSFHQALPHGPLRVASDQEHFWKAHFADTPKSAFAGVDPLTEDVSMRDALVNLTFDDYKGYEACRRKLSTTHQAIVQACWIAVLRSILKRPVVVGIVVSGRSIDIPHAERVIGPLFNTIPFYLDVDGSMTWSEIVKRCHDFNTMALTFQHTPLRDVTRWCRDMGLSSGRTIFDTLFVFQKPDRRGSPTESLWTALDSGFQADYPIALEVEQLDDEVNMSLATQTRMSNESKSLEVLQTFKGVLNSLIQSPESKIGDTLDLPKLGSEPVLASKDVSRRMTDHQNHREQSFEWDETSKYIRSEIASLAETEEENISPNTSILELGLDSIDAVKLSSRLKRKGLQVSVSSIMRDPKVSGISAAAKRVTDKKNSKNHATVDLEAEEQSLRQHLKDSGSDLSCVERVLPVTPLQEAMLAEMFATEYERYFNHDVLELSPEIDTQQLQSAWQKVYDKTEILRTSFTEIDSPDIHTTFAQIIRKPHQIPWVCRDAVAEVTDALLDEIRKDSLQSSSFLHLTLVHPKRDHKRYLILSIAHALYDGWSLGLLHADVAQAYHGDAKARSSFDGVLGSIIDQARSSESQEYWRDALKNLAPTHFPRRPSSNASYGDHTHRREKTSRTNLPEVSDFCKKQGVTIGALAQTAWSLILSSRVKKLDVAFGVVLSGRDDEESGEMMFPTMNTVAARSIIHGTRKEMVRYMQDNMSAMSLHERYPLRKAQALTDAAGDGLFDTLFIYQKRPQASEEKTLKIYNSVGGDSNTEYSVCVEAEVVEESLVWRNACKDDYLDRDQAEQLLEDLDEALAQIIDSPDDPALVWENGRVNICGFEPFKEAEDSSQPQPGILNQPGDHANGSASATEKIITSILAEVAGVSEADVSGMSSMFHLGLDSISAIKVSSLLRKRGVKLSVSQMLKSGTVAKMAAAAETADLDVDERQYPDSIKASRRALEQALSKVDIPPLLSEVNLDNERVEAILPASAGQVYMMSVSQKEGLFFPTFSYQLRGNVTVKAICAAWDRLIEELPILRTWLVATGRDDLPFVQIIVKHGIVSVAKDRHIETDSVQLTISPFVRLTVTQIHDGWDLHLRIHHALYDGISLPLMMKHFQHLLSGPDVEKKNVSKSMVDLLSLTNEESRKSARRSFWQAYLSNINPHRMRTSASSNRRTEVFNPAVLSDISALTAYSRQNGISTHALFLAAYASIYARMTSNADQEVVLGIYLANRSLDLPGIESLMAPTVNLVPLRVRLGRELVAVARNIQDDLQAIGSAENCSVGLWEIYKWTEGRVTIDTFVNFLALPEDESMPADAQSGGLSITPSPRHNSPIDEPWSRVVETGAEEGRDDEERKKQDEKVQKLTGRNSVTDAYVPSLDIEASIKNGKLAIGVFAPEKLVDLAEAERLIGDIGESLGRLC